MASKLPEIDNYGQEMLTLIGVVTLRAGHLEDYLVHFMQAVSGIPYPQARALFYTTPSAKGRLNMIRSLLKVSGFSDARTKFASDLLDDAQTLANQRNDLIHDQYFISMEGGSPAPPKRIRMQYKPLAKREHTTETVNEGEILRLAEAYEGLRQRLWDFYVDVAMPKVNGRPSRGTPD